MSAALSRFNAGIQISEHGLNEILKAMSEFKVVPSELSGSFRNHFSPIGFTLDGTYEVALPTPEIFLDTQSGDRVGLRGTVSGESTVWLKLNGEQGHTADWKYRFGISASYELITHVSIEEASKEAYLAIRFVELSNLELDLQGQMPEFLTGLLQKLARRFVEVHLIRRVVKVPLTPWFATQELGGWNLEPPVVRVIDGPQPTDHDSLTVAFNTWPNRGTGNASGLSDWVHDGTGKAMVGVAVDERFLLQTLQVNAGKLSIPKRFNEQGRPDDKGSIDLSRVVVNLSDGYIYVTVEATATVDGKPMSVFAHAKASIYYQNMRFDVKVYDVEIELPWFVHLVGFVLFQLYYLVIIAVVQSILGKSLGNVGEDFLEEFLNGGSIPLSFATALGETPLRIATEIHSIEILPSELRVLADLRITSRQLR